MAKGGLISRRQLLSKGLTERGGRSPPLAHGTKYCMSSTISYIYLAMLKFNL